MMRLFRVLPNQHNKETTLVEAKNKNNALYLAQGLYGAFVLVREIEYFSRE